MTNDGRRETQWESHWQFIFYTIPSDPSFHNELRAERSEEPEKRKPQMPEEFHFRRALSSRSQESYSMPILCLFYGSEPVFEYY